LGKLRQGTTFTLPQASSEIFAGGQGKAAKHHSKISIEEAKASVNRAVYGRATRINLVLDLLMEVIDACGQQITSLITAAAVREMRLKIGDTVAALIKSTEVMLVRS